MEIDLTEFYGVFYEDALEHLSELEELLLAVAGGDPDPEALNAIFRAAHSLKGESGALGFDEITTLAHSIETLLDEVRSGERPLTATLVDLVISGNDCLRLQVEARRDETPLDVAQIDRVRDQIERVLATSPDAADQPLAQHAEGATGEVAVTGKAHDATIRVSVGKIDTVVNLVGELVIIQSMLNQLRDREDLKGEETLHQGLDLLQHNTRELQERVMNIRMFPVRNVFQRFPRIVRDIARDLGKQARLVLEGESTELDKSVIERIGDPLTHLIRNALDHGLETPDEREAAGKSVEGRVMLSAEQVGGRIQIRVQDDGRGVNIERVRAKAMERGLIAEDEDLSDEDVINLIFEPAFSTAEEVSDISGRGVGMDVVRSNIEELNGTVQVSSVAGEGTSFEIQLPLTLVIMDGQLLEVKAETFVLPLISVLESVEIEHGDLQHIAAGCVVYQMQGQYIPVVRLDQVFGLPGSEADFHEAILVIIETERDVVGVVIEELGAQQQVVVKSLEDNYEAVAGVSGATILGNGRVALILDPEGLVQLAGLQQSRRLVRQLNTADEEKEAAGDG